RVQRPTPFEDDATAQKTVFRLLNNTSERVCESVDELIHMLRTIDWYSDNLPPRHVDRMKVDRIDHSGGIYANDSEAFRSEFADVPALQIARENNGRAL